MSSIEIIKIDKLADAGDDAKRRVYSMLKADDRESVPESSSQGTRGSAADLKTAESTDPSAGLWRYYEGLLSQSILLAWAGDEIIGLCSYDPDRKVDLSGGLACEHCVYHSTTIVAPEYENTGVAELLQEALEADADRLGRRVVRRT